MELAFSWLAVSCGAVAIFWLRLHYQRLNLKSQMPEIKRVAAQLERLGEDVDALYGEVHSSLEQFNERLDFAERMLSRPAPEASRDLTPESTPV